jgi:hypothetical protein
VLPADSCSFGGQARASARIENYLGFQFSHRMLRQEAGERPALPSCVVYPAELSAQLTRRAVPGRGRWRRTIALRLIERLKLR